MRYEDLTQRTANFMAWHHGYRAGKEGLPKPIYSQTPEGKALQEISDEAYEKGAQSNRFINIAITT